MNVIRKLFFTKPLLRIGITSTFNELGIPYKLQLEDSILDDVVKNLKKYQNIEIDESKNYLFAITDPELNTVVVFVDQFKRAAYDADLTIGMMEWLIKAKLIHEKQHVLQFEYLKLRGGVRALNNLFDCEKYYEYGKSPIELNATYAEDNMKNFYDMRFLDSYLY